MELIQANDEDHCVAALGALTGNQAVQQVRAGLQAIYLSGWQVAADANLSGQTYPDQSLYPANSVPAVVRRINNALLRAGQIEAAEASSGVPDRRRCRGRLRRIRSTPTSSMQRHDRGRRRRACTGRTSSRARRSAATWAARCSCRSRQHIRTLNAAAARSRRGGRAHRS